MGERRLYQRRDEGLEFDRIAFFSDAVFAIAMTLLVVTIDPPRGVSEAELGRVLRDQVPSIMSFFLSFAVIAFFWVGHHRFVAALAFISPPLLWLNLAFLAVIAFVPFPTDVLGEHGTDAAVLLYAGTIATVSLIDTAMLVSAQRTGAFRVPPSPQTFRYELAESVIPVVVFLVSMPVALVNGIAAQLMWVAIIPAERIATGRRRRSQQGPVPPAPEGRSGPGPPGDPSTD